MDNQLVVILEKTISPNQQELIEARDFLEIALVNQYEAVVFHLSTILAYPNYSPVVRMQAGLQLKNVVFSNEVEQKIIKQNRWLSIAPDSRERIKMNCFSALGTQQQGFHSAAQCVAYIACVEIPVNQWPEIIQMLVANITGHDATETLKMASLEALGYICNEIDANILASRSDEILTGIVCGMKAAEPSNRVRKAATNALLNSLEFTRENFGKDQERNYLMQIVCESTQCTDIEVAVVGLQCMVKIMSQYYGHMEPYMSRALFGITLEAMKSGNDSVVLQGIEFWSTVCEEELELSLEADDCRERGLPPPMVANNNYARGALKFLVPILLEILSRQEEGDDDDEWNPHKASGVCLALLAQTCEEAIVELVLPFVTQHINAADWRLRDAAVMSFGSILEGPAPASLESLVSQAMPVIIGLLVDQYPMVRDTAAWTIGRVCEVLPQVPLSADILPSLLHAMLQALTSSEIRVATNVCWAIGSLADGAHSVAGHNDDTYALSPYFGNLVDHLLATSVRSDCGHSNLRNAAYSALMELTKSAPRDCYQCIQQTTMAVLTKLDSLLQIQDTMVSSQDKVQMDEYQSLLCGTLQSVLRKITRDDALTIAQNIIVVLFDMMQRAQNNIAAGASGANTATGVQEDALLAVSALIDSIGPHFSAFVPQLMTVLMPCLYNMSGDTQICANAVGVVGDLARNLTGDVLAPYLDAIITIFDATLQNGGTPRTLLPIIIATYGDFALQLGDLFAPYRPQVLITLSHACRAEVNLNDADMVEYLNSLRSSCIDTFVGLIQGAKSDSPTDNPQRLSFIIPHMEFIVRFVEHIGGQAVSSDELIGACCGLIGDIATAFGRESMQVLDTEAINALISRARQYKNVSTKKYAVWAYKEMKKLRG